MLASIGLPGLSGFVSEFLVLIGTFAAHAWWALVATLGVVLAALYLLWAYQRVFQGRAEADNAAARRRDARRALGHGAGRRARGRPRASSRKPGARPDLAVGRPRLHRARRARRRWPSDRDPRPVDPLPGDPAGAHPLRRRARAARRAGAAARRALARAVDDRRSTAGRRGRRRSSSAFFQWSDVARHGASTTIAHAIVLDGFASWPAGGRRGEPRAWPTLVAHDWVARERVAGAEYHVLALWPRPPGAVLMAQANDLVVDLPGPGDPLDRPLRARRLRPPPRESLAEAGAQVLPAGRLRVGDLHLRRGPGLRRDRVDQPVEPVVLPRRQRPAAPGAALRRGRAARRGLRLQGRRGALPHVVARRLRGRADAGRPASWPRSSRSARSPRSCACSSRRWAPSSTTWRPIIFVLVALSRPRRRGPGRGAAQRQAHARLLVDQPRRLHPAGPLRRRRPAAPRRRSSTS